MRKLIVLFLLLCGSASHAASLQYNFSYTFDDGEMLTGALMGTLQLDSDTIVIDEVLDIYYSAPLQDDCCIPSPNFDSLNDWNGAGEVSLSGATMNFQSELPAAYADYWALTAGTAAVYDAWFDITCLEFCGEFVQQESFSAGNWSIIAVPIPAAIWLFGSALAGLGWLRRRPAA